MQIGDKVKFINESLEGIITRLIDTKMIGVSIEDGFEIPVLRNEIMIVSNANLVEDYDKKETPKYPSLVNSGSEIMVLFEQSSPTWYKASLVNNSPYDILLSVTNKQAKNYRALFGGKIEKGTTYLINTLNLEELTQWGTYCFRIIFHEKESELPMAPWYLEYTFRTKDFIKVIDVNGKPTFLVALKPDKVEQFTLAADSIRIKPKLNEDIINITRPQEVVDLHIHQLVKNFDELSAEEAMVIQINYFKNSFEKAIALNYSKITIIHGVGTNALKQKIWKEISGHLAVKTFYEAQKEKFGYGATEIIFK
ncbi:MAG: Smr/MutS family protein [Bacteroidia bacterium]